VGMKDTGVYWHDVSTLEGSFELVVANAQHIKAVSGHKTDVQEAEWIADLLQHGLVTASVKQGSSLCRSVWRKIPWIGCVSFI
jgi:transposase